MPRPLSALPKQSLDSPHRQEESFLNFGQFNESVSPVESSRGLIPCVYDNASRCDLLARIKAAVEGIHEQDLSEASPAKFGTHSQTAKKGRRYHRILQPPGAVFLRAAQGRSEVLASWPIRAPSASCSVLQLREQHRSVRVDSKPHLQRRRGLPPADAKLRTP